MDKQGEILLMAMLMISQQLSALYHQAAGAKDKAHSFVEDANKTAKRLEEAVARSQD